MTMTMNDNHFQFCSVYLRVDRTISAARRTATSRRLAACGLSSFDVTHIWPLEISHVAL